MSLFSLELVLLVAIGVDHGQLRLGAVGEDFIITIALVENFRGLHRSTDLWQRHFMYISRTTLAQELLHLLTLLL